MAFLVSWWVYKYMCMFVCANAGVCACMYVYMCVCRLEVTLKCFIPLELPPCFLRHSFALLELAK